jgi:hypothetical protein
MAEKMTAGEADIDLTFSPIPDPVTINLFN